MPCSSFHLIACITILWLCYPQLSFAGNSETDRIALLEMKAKITHDPRGVVNSWKNESFHFCKWYGITCDHKHKRVIKLDLHSSNLTGSLSPYLGNLTFLRSLILLNNSFFGPIPPQIGLLHRLQYFSLYGNHMSGEVPMSIFNISTLESLDLGQNQLQGRLPLDIGHTLPYLKSLSILMNHFTGSIPTSISNCSNLEILNLGTNNLHGQVPLLDKLNKLRRILLSENNLGNGHTTDLDFVYSLTNSTRLEQFHIFSNNFQGVFPKVICNFSVLVRLGIANNTISGDIPSCIGKLIHLEEVFASRCNLSGIIPPSIVELKNLQRLILSYNRLSGQLPTSIGNLTQLGTLHLFANNLQGQIPSTIGSCRSLDTVDLSYNNLSGRIPSQIFSLPSLSIELSLSHNYLSGPLPVQVGGLSKLSTLDLCFNRLSGEIPSAIGGCQSLVSLYMRGNFFQGAIPSALSTLKSLNDLDLSQNHLSGRIPDFLATFKLLKLLNLSNNDLEGQLPKGGIFSTAIGLSVSGNSRLCGGISELKLPQCDSNKINKGRLSHRMIQIVVFLSVFSSVILFVAFGMLYAFYWRKRGNELKSLGSQASDNPLPNLSYQSLLKSTNWFSSENLIGIGSFGVVYKGTLDEIRITNVAIKKFNLEHKGAFKSFMAECEVLRNIRHRNLVKVITACSSIDYQGNDFKALVYEYMANGSLDDWLHPQPSSSIEETKRLNLLQRLDVAVDVAFALEYLHYGLDTLVVHCDLKPSNVLLDDEMVAHVGDFGLAKFLSSGSSTSPSDQSSSIGVRGTVGYTPPEYGMGNEVSKYGDVYSFGILIMEMFTGKRPTHSMFKDSSSLRSNVKASLPERVTEILDNALLEDIVGDNMMIMLDGVISVLEIALSCSNELPQQRLDMNDVVSSLSSIRNKLVETCSRPY